MNLLCTLYRKASRELALPSDQQQLLSKLLREIATNTIQRRLAWNVKADFITLMFISAGRYPQLAVSPLIDWIVAQLPFKLNEQEIQILKS